MLRIAVLGLCLAAVAPCATIITGELVLSGAEFWSRGYGRSIFFDLRAMDGSFRIAGEDGDTTSENPGTIVGGAAIAGPTARLSRVSRPLDVNGQSTIGRTSSVLLFDTVPVPVPMVPEPGPNFGDYVDFTLPATPFTLQSHLTVYRAYDDAGNLLDEPQLVIDTDVVGRGLVTMSGSLVRGEPGEPIGAFIEAARFEFSEVPEPSSFVLVAMAGLAIKGCCMLNRRRKSL